MIKLLIGLSRYSQFMIQHDRTVTELDATKLTRPKNDTITGFFESLTRLDELSSFTINFNIHST